MYNAYQYIVSNDGLDCEDSYPYMEYVSYTLLNHVLATAREYSSAQTMNGDVGMHQTHWNKKSP